MVTLSGQNSLVMGDTPFTQTLWQRQLKQELSIIDFPASKQEYTTGMIKRSWDKQVALANTTPLTQRFAKHSLLNTDYYMPLMGQPGNSPHHAPRICLELVSMATAHSLIQLKTGGRSSTRAGTQGDWASCSTEESSSGAGHFSFTESHSRQEASFPGSVPSGMP